MSNSISEADFSKQGTQHGLILYIADHRANAYLEPFNGPSSALLDASLVSGAASLVRTPVQATNAVAYSKSPPPHVAPPPMWHPNQNITTLLQHRISQPILAVRPSNLKSSLSRA